LLDRFDIFSSIDSINVLQNEFLPKIARFTDDMKLLEDSNQDCRNIIVGFDETLSLKLNKCEITAIKVGLDNN